MVTDFILPTVELFPPKGERASLPPATSLLLFLPATSKRIPAILDLCIEGDRQVRALAAIPDSIGNLVALQKLSISGHRFDDLPATIYHLQSLSSLDLHSNRLDKLPDSLGGLGSLRHFDLHDNALCSLPETIGQLEMLEYLDLHANRLAELPWEIGDLRALKYLDLRDNPLASLPDALGNLDQLQFLGLPPSGVSGVPGNLAGVTIRNNVETDRVVKMQTGFRISARGFACCDRCHKEEVPPLTLKRKNGRLLCPDCLKKSS